MVGHALKHRMARGSGLNQHESASVATSGAPRNLEQELKSPLMGPKVGAAEHGVCIGYYSQGQAGEVQALADHLGSDDKVYFAGFHPLQKVGHGALAPCRVGIHAQDSRFRKKRFHFFFDALGSESAPIPGRLAALRAGFGQVFVQAAVVADEFAVVFVVGQRDVAVRAGFNPSAVGAGENRCVSSAVLKDEHLLLVGQALL